MQENRVVFEFENSFAETRNKCLELTVVLDVFLSSSKCFR